MNICSKIIIKREHQPHGSKIICIALVVFGTGSTASEARLKIVRGNDGNPLVRWPREMIDGNNVYQFRMQTAEATRQVEREVLEKAKQEGAI